MSTAMPSQVKLQTLVIKVDNTLMVIGYSKEEIAQGVTSQK
jgi:hypothetical protein